MGAIFQGFDTASGGPLIGLLNASLAMLLLWQRPLRMVTWRMLAPPLLLLLLAWLWVAAGSAGVASAPALVPDLALPRLLGLCGVGAALIAGCAVGTGDQAFGRAIDGLVTFGAVVALIGLVGGSGGPIADAGLWEPGQYGRFAGTLGNANVAGTYYGVVAVLALARALRAIERRAMGDPRGSVVAAVSVAACGVANLALIATQSRTALATTSLSCLALMMVPTAGLRARTRAVIAIAILLALGLAVLLLQLDQLPGRMAATGDDWALRLTMWRHYLDLAAQSPLWGHGAGAFASVNAQALGDPVQASQLWPVNAAHNILLHMVIEGGLPFMLLVVAALAVMMVPVLIGIASRGVPVPEAGCVAALVVIAVSSLVDIALNIPLLATLFWFLVGLLRTRMFSVARR